MIKDKSLLVLSLLATLLLSQYYKTSVSIDISPSTSKPPNQTPQLEKEGQICCPKTLDINVQIKRRARIVPVTPNMGARPSPRSRSSAIGKHISSFQVCSSLSYLLSLSFFLL
ncbi:hypothetical protein RND71_042186 [Anisodus tanguticus]|uniref:Uncharacterized protein n=1 Tax=Anisodus tanguticus TaxID=243964 RepID=A0AAE1QR32_9SOLA|nr:hypothetical protein RND71_042186 [Anisodus tanguticus]